MRRTSLILLTLALAVCVSTADAQKGRDLSKLRPCEVVTGKEVAAIAKGKLMSEPLAGSSACAYLIELANGQVESYRLFLHGAATIEALLQAKSPAEKGERVPGLWDEAYVSKQPMASGLSLAALRRGDMAVEVTGERKEVLIGVAKLAIGRLK